MMSQETLKELPYERIAMSGGEMPDDLESSDQTLFLHLRLLYDTYKKGIITREQAKREKGVLLRSYQANKLMDDIAKEWIRSLKESEIARANYRKNKTIENADKMLAAVEGRKNVS